MRHRNEVVKEDSGKNFKNELKGVIEDAFLNALEDDWRTPKLHNLTKHKPKVLKVNIMESPVDRLLNSISEEKKAALVKDYLQKIHDEYDVFQDQVQSKMKYLDFFLEKWSQKKLNFIV